MNTPDQIIFVNGQSRPFVDQALSQALAANGFDPAQSGFAVAVNAVVAPRAEWNTIRLQPDDRVEIIQAAAGG